MKYQPLMYIPSRREQAIVDVIRDKFPSLQPVTLVMGDVPVISLQQDGEPYLLVYNEFLSITKQHKETE